MIICEKGFVYFDNWIWTGGGKFFLLRREYLSLTVAVLTNSPKFSDLTKRAAFQLNLSQNDETKA